jgi:hypothetical protein
MANLGEACSFALSAGHFFTWYFGYGVELADD